jgi:hypothetical protein
MARQKVHSPDYLAQMKRLVANWPVDEQRGKVLLDEYQAIWEEVGEHRFTRAVDSLVASAPYLFFPNQAEFRGYIPATGKKPSCGKCDSGWLMVPDAVARGVYGDPNAMMAIRCECRRGPSYQTWRESPEWRPFS